MYNTGCSLVTLSGANIGPACSLLQVGNRVADEKVVEANILVIPFL